MVRYCIKKYNHRMEVRKNILSHAILEIKKYDSKENSILLLNIVLISDSNEEMS